MRAIEIIDEYNRNLRSIGRKEANKIFHEHVSEYKKENPYSSDYEFLYPEILGWDENWLKNMDSGKSPEEMANEYIEKFKKSI